VSAHSINFSGKDNLKLTRYDSFEHKRAIFTKKDGNNGFSEQIKSNSPFFEWNALKAMPINL